MVKTDRTRSQWLDLGNQSRACITIPEPCGAHGGTVSAWVKRDGNHAEGGVISSMTQVQTSFTIVLHNNNLRYAADHNVFLFYLCCSNLCSIVVDRILYILKVLETISHFCRGTDTPVWTSGDVSFGFESKKGQSYSCSVEAYVLHVPEIQL